MSSSEFFVNLLQTFPAVLYVATPDPWKWIFVSDYLQEFLGYSPDEFTNEPDLFESRIHPDDRTLFHYHQSRRSNVPSVGEFRIRRKDGQEIWVRDHSLLKKDHSCYGLLIDITHLKRQDAVGAEERSRLEQHIRALQRFEAIGTLAAGVAHEFNNLLMAISGQIEVFKTRTQGAVPPELQEIQRATAQGSVLTRQLLAFGGKQIQHRQRLQLNEILEDLKPVLLRLLSPDFHLDLLLAPDLGVFEADAGQIRDLIMNLILVARDAMPEGGKIVIETSNEQIEDQHLQDRPNMQKGPYVSFCVSDTGPGLDEDAKAHVFEPFYRRKDGTVVGGLRLPGIYGAVKQNGGYVWVEGEPRKGTSFRVYFPRAYGLPEQIAQPLTRPPSVSGKKTILVVDDNEAVRTAIAAYLQMSGFEVEQASDGKKAVQLANSRSGDEIALLITDVVMPVMGGMELSEELMKFHRKMKVLFMSGYTEESMVRKGNLPAGTSFLQKPAPMHVVLKKVQELLNS